MLLDDPASVKAALATMNPTAREATQLLVHRIIERPILLDQREEMQTEALQACAISFLRSGRNIQENQPEWAAFLENHGANVIDIAVSVVLCLERDAQRRKRWGLVGKIAAGVGMIGAAALGAYFG
jgi:hypothetical protein